MWLNYLAIIRDYGGIIQCDEGWFDVWTWSDYRDGCKVERPWEVPCPTVGGAKFCGVVTAWRVDKIKISSIDGGKSTSLIRLGELVAIVIVGLVLCAVLERGTFVASMIVELDR